ncbi:MAG: Trans-aconitate 2-methyltransferase [Chlamydiia bacterium]|nr:Trans-aconitate 2-methyltransferase [Chlamydiia bacterium]
MKKRFFSALLSIGLLSSFCPVDVDAFLDPSQYNKNSEMQQRVAKKQFEKININGDEHILDIGCGDGGLTNELGKNLTTGTIKGVDPSKSMIEHAKNKYSSKKVSFDISDAESLNEVEKYNVITCFSAFQWFVKPKEAFANMVKALKKNGTIHIVTFPLESPDWASFVKALESKEKWVKYKDQTKRSFMLYSDEYAELAKKHKLEVIDLTTVDDFSIHPDIDHYKRYVKGWVSSFAPVPELEIDEYVNAIVEHTKDQFSKDDKGNIKAPFKKITMVVKKTA